MKLLTCIPAYKVEFFQDTLECLSRQTIKPDMVLVSDDTKDSSFLSEIKQKSYQDLTKELNVKVVQGPKRGAGNNISFLEGEIRKMKPKFAHFLMDDDILFPRFYERHLGALDNSQSFVSISRRLYSNEHGLPIYDPNLPGPINQRNEKVLTIDEDFIFSTSISICNNWLGELSNAVIKGTFFVDGGSVHYYDQWCVYGLGDIATFLNLSRQHGLIFHNEVLGFFRQNRKSNTAQKHERTFSFAILCWLILGLIAKKKEFISDQNFKLIISHVRSLYIKYFNDDFVSDLNNIHDSFTTEAFDKFELKVDDFWRRYMESYSNLNRYQSSRHFPA
jgi:hypothetical protein